MPFPPKFEVYFSFQHPHPNRFIPPSYYHNLMTSHVQNVYPFNISTQRSISQFLSPTTPTPDIQQQTPIVHRIHPNSHSMQKYLPTTKQLKQYKPQPQQQNFSFICLNKRQYYANYSNESRYSKIRIRVKSNPTITPVKSIADIVQFSSKETNETNKKRSVQLPMQKITLQLLKKSTQNVCPPAILTSMDQSRLISKIRNRIKMRNSHSLYNINSRHVSEGLYSIIETNKRKNVQAVKKKPGTQFGNKSLKNAFLVNKLRHLKNGKLLRLQQKGKF